MGRAREGLVFSPGFLRIWKDFSLLASSGRGVYNRPMRQTTKNSIFRLAPGRHVLLLVSAAVIAAQLLTRRSHALNRRLSERFVRPLHRALSQASARLPFSLAELLIGLAAISLIVYIILSIKRLIVEKHRIRQVYIIFITLASAGLAVYAGFCLLWGVYYYGDDFAAQSGLKSEPVSVQELQTVTAWFAGLCNEYAGQVPRDENGVCAADRAEVLRRSDEVYAEAEKRFPCMEGPAIRAKGIFFSRLLSYTDFTGFFFPFTAEANVNTDFPPALFAATVAHELAHQRGVAKEQEANFCAVMASLLYGDPVYCYSACLLACTHLGSALRGADPAAWEEIRSTLSEPVVRDLAAERAYWKQFETPVQTVSNTVYEGFLHSYDQELGLKSYGACVDLLVRYYYEAASGLA